MDPISAFGLAVNVLTVIDIGFKIAAAYRDGGVPEASQVEDYAVSFGKLADNLKSKNRSPQSTTDLERNLRDRAAKAAEISKQLQDELKSRQSDRSIKRAFRSIRNVFSKKVQDLEKKLRDIQSEIDSNLLVLLRKDMRLNEVKRTEQYNSLDDSMKALLEEFCKSDRKLTDLIETENEKTRQTISAQHETTRQAIQVDGEATRRAITAREEQNKFSERKDKILNSLISDNPFSRESEIHGKHDGTLAWIFADEFDYGGYNNDESGDDDDDDGNSVDNNDGGGDDGEEKDDDDRDRGEDNDSEAGGNNNRKPSEFSAWLRTGQTSEIFWIQGKPGSGKSTLMKYISRAEQTRNHLKLWAPPEGPLVIKFFFWLADPKGMQNSFKGFLCYLLYQILKENWAQEDNFFINSILYEETKLHHWSNEDLKKLLEKAVEETTRWMFFLVDGLDECKEEDFEEVMEIINLFNSRPNVKCCVSSRPEHRIISQLETTQLLKVQDYTRRDIEKYVTDGLGRIKVKLSDERRRDLIQKIVDRAEGVFLWAMIVSKDIRTGITNEDHPEQLFERLNRLPSGMFELYQAMLKRLGSDKEMYEREAAPYFWAVLTFEKRALDLWRRSSTGSYLVMTLPRLGEVVPFYEDFKRGGSKIGTVDDEIDLLEKVKRRINIVCAGMLTVGRAPDVLDDKSPHFFEGFKGSHKQTLYLKSCGRTLRFIHRTARDFIEETGKSIFERCQMGEIKLFELFIKGKIRMQRVSGFREFDIPTIGSTLEHLAYKGDEVAMKLEFLADFEREMSDVLSDSEGKANEQWVYELAKTGVAEDGQLLDLNAIVMRYGSDELLESRFGPFLTLPGNNQRCFSIKYKNYLLFCAANSRRLDWVQRLLENDANPNSQFYLGMQERLRRSPWLEFLRRDFKVHFSKHEPPYSSGHSYLSAIRKFLDSGASINDRTLIVRYLRNRDYGSYLADWVLETEALKALSRPSSINGVIYVMEVNAKHLLEVFCNNQLEGDASDILSRPDVQASQSYLRILLCLPRIRETSPSGASDYPITTNMEEIKKLNIEENDSLNGPVSAIEVDLTASALLSDDLYYMQDDPLRWYDYSMAVKKPLRHKEKLINVLEGARRVDVFGYLEKLGYYKYPADPAVPQESIPMFIEDERT
ncbi:hypothetical protein ABW19_dt0204871 [Dactylella cylindrospora]|nr:hypothetical protein ABW19_dt0204871 [Dactylella cylindrospora]